MTDLRGHAGRPGLERADSAARGGRGFSPPGARCVSRCRWPPTRARRASAWRRWRSWRRSCAPVRCRRGWRRRRLRRRWRSPEKAVVLGAEELRPIGVLVTLAERARRFFLSFSGPSKAPEPPCGYGLSDGRSPSTPDVPSTGRGLHLPEVAALARALEPPLGLARAVDDTFDAAGEIRDSAPRPSSSPATRRAQQPAGAGARRRFEEL